MKIAMANSAIMGHYGLWDRGIRGYHTVKKSVKKLSQGWRDHAKRTIPSEGLIGFVNWFEILDFTMQKWYVDQKLSHTFSNAPIFKHQTFFLQELTQNQRIQLGPVDLGILCHSVSIYSSIWMLNDVENNHFKMVHKKIYIVNQIVKFRA